MQIEKRQLSELIPYINNSRKHSDDQVTQIAASIKEFGWTNPILVDGDNGIIAGHGRIMAAKKLNMTEVPVIELAHLSKEQRKALIIADNKLALNSDWDSNLLAIELKDLQDLGFDLNLTGFDADELANILLPEQVEGLTDEDAIPETPIEPKTKLGDIYQLGNHRLMCGDSCNIEQVEQLTNGLVDILVTDPPYNVNYEGATKDKLTIMNDSMGDEQFRQFLRDAFVAANTVMKPGAVFYIWHADSEGYNFRGACRDANWKVRQTLIWQKDSMVMGRQDYHWKHEPCLYGWKEGAAHLWATDRKQTTIIHCKKPRINDIHPTMKPVELMEYQILNNTKGMDIVLDLFGGSGSTMIACEKVGRQSRLMELDPKYCDVIVKRWEDFTGKKAELIQNDL
jgi:site-specific DNA-methyltransferase (adenine-specific)